MKVAKLLIPGKPMGKQRPRFMRKTSITYTPKETINYETLVQQLYISKFKNLRFEGPLKMNIAAYFGIPKSKSKKAHERMLAGYELPTKKPDMDNIIKIVADALNGIAYYDDCQIVQCKVEKFYTMDPRVEIEIQELEEAI